MGNWFPEFVSDAVEIPRMRGLDASATKMENKEEAEGSDEDEGEWRQEGGGGENDGGGSIK